MNSHWKYLKKIKQNYSLFKSIRNKKSQCVGRCDVDEGDVIFKYTS